MANGIRIQFRNQLNDVFVITVFPTADFDGEYNDFPAAAGTIQLSAQASDDSKIFTGIIPKTFQFGYLIPASSTIGNIDFFTRPTLPFAFNAWTVEVHRGEQIFFKGYLNLENNSEEFFNRKRVITLTAVDGLHALKAIPFKKFDSTFQYSNRETVLFWLFQAIGKIGFQDMPIVTDFNVTHNLMLGRTIDVTYDPLDHIILESELWLDRDGTAKNTDEVLNTICKAFKLRIYQENGQWVVESLADRIYSYYRSYSVWNFTGVFNGEMTYFQVDNALKITQVCSIGLNNQIKIVGGDTLRRIQMPKSSVRIDFPYRFPDEFFSNQKLQEFGPAVAIPVGAPVGGGFALQSWDHRRNDGTPPTDLAFHWQEFNDNDPVNGDIQDYCVGTQIEFTGNAFSSYLRSTDYFLVNTGDSFTYSFTTKGTNPGKFGTDRDGGRAIVRMILVGDSGNIYTLDSILDFSVFFHEIVYFWTPSTANTLEEINNSNSTFLRGGWDAKEVVSEWKTFEFLTSGAPEPGRVYMDLIQWFDIIIGEGGGGGQRTDFKNISIIPSSKNIGDFNLVENEGLIIEEYKEEVEISDGFTPSALGGLYNFISGAQSGEVLFSPQWFFYGQTTQKLRFTKLMACVLQSYMRRIYDKLETQVKGYAFEANDTVLHCGFLPRYIFSDYNGFKEFMLTGSYSFDLVRGIWRGVFVEVDADNHDDFEFLSLDNELKISYKHTFEYIKKRS